MLFLMTRPQPASTLFPYTTLFRSAGMEPKDVKLLPAGDNGANLAAVLNRAVDRKSTRLNSSHANISYAVFCLKKTTISCLAPLSAIDDLDPERTASYSLLQYLLAR